MMNDLSKNFSNKTEAVSVSDFLHRINSSLSSHFGRVQGEVTTVNEGYPKAIYFTIKDTEKDALLNCVVWRSVYGQNGVDLKVGDKVVLTGMPEIFVPKGNFSLKVQTIEYAGEGALKKAYEDLKKKLQDEGLFDQARKKSLPKYPKRIGVITSKAGVVMQDFSSNLGRYGFQVTMVDSRVEGKDAIHEILASIKTLQSRDIEVLVIMRGGGSWESLQAFNTESVVRAISGFKCPVLTGIGHDVDVTLSELVADVGASTPTAVAEALNETWDTLTSSLESAKVRILSSFQRSVSGFASSFNYSSGSVTRLFYRSLSDISRRLSRDSSRVRSYFMDLERKILRARSSFQSVVGIMKSNIHARRKHLEGVPKRIKGFTYDLVGLARKDISEGARLILSAQIERNKKAQESLLGLEKDIRKSDPMHNLKLGYSLTYLKGKIVRSAKDIKVGDSIDIHVVDGEFTSEIKNIT